MSFLTSFHHSAYGIRQGIKDDFEIAGRLEQSCDTIAFCACRALRETGQQCSDLAHFRAGTINRQPDYLSLGGDEAAIDFATAQKTLHRRDSRGQGNEIARRYRFGRCAVVAHRGLVVHERDQERDAWHRRMPVPLSYAATSVTGSPTLVALDHGDDERSSSPGSNHRPSWARGRVASVDASAARGAVVKPCSGHYIQRRGIACRGIPAVFIASGYEAV